MLYVLPDVRSCLEHLWRADERVEIKGIVTDGIEAFDQLDRWISKHLFNFVFTPLRVEPASDRLRERYILDSVRCLGKRARPIHVFHTGHAARDFMCTFQALFVMH